jgi:hypothetical protein
VKPILIEVGERRASNIRQRYAGGAGEVVNSIEPLDRLVDVADLTLGDAARKYIS